MPRVYKNHPQSNEVDAIFVEEKKSKKVAPYLYVKSTAKSSPVQSVFKQKLWHIRRRIILLTFKTIFYFLFKMFFF